MSDDFLPSGHEAPLWEAKSPLGSDCRQLFRHLITEELPSRNDHPLFGVLPESALGLPKGMLDAPIRN